MLACMDIFTHVQWLWSSEEDATPPGAGVASGCEPLCGCWALNPGLSQKEQVLLSIKLCPQPPQSNLLIISYNQTSSYLCLGFYLKSEANV